MIDILVRRREQTENEMLACAHPAFDGPVILFQDIIEILRGTVFRVLV